MRPCVAAPFERRQGQREWQRPRSHRPGRAKQVGIIKPASKAPGSERLKLKCVMLLSNPGFKFNLRRYNPVIRKYAHMSWRGFQAGAYTRPFLSST